MRPLGQYDRSIDEYPLASICADVFAPRGQDGTYTALLDITTYSLEGPDAEVQELHQGGFPTAAAAMRWMEAHIQAHIQGANPPYELMRF